MTSSKKAQDTLRGEIYKTIQVGSPIIIAQLLQMSMNFVDTVMAGRYSPEAIGAVAIGGATAMPFLVFGMGFIVAINPMVAHHLGARKLHLIGKTMRQALWVSQMIALPFFFLLRSMEPLLIAMEITAEIQPITLGYLDAFSWGIPFMLAFSSMRSFNEGLSITRPAMYISVLGLLVNIVLNYGLIYGRLGFPQLGAVGCGYATSVVYILMFAAMLLFTIWYPGYQRFKIFDTLRPPEWTFIKEITSIGLPIGLSVTMEVALFAAVSLLMGSLGTLEVAAHQIAINVASMTFMIPLGLSMAVSSRVGQAAGAKNKARVRFRGWVGIGLCAFTMVLTAIILALFPESIVRIYTQDTGVVELASGLILLAALFQISDGLQVGGYGALRGLKDTRVPMIFNFISYWLIGFPVGYYLGLHTSMGPAGLWIGLIAGLTVAALFHNGRFWQLSRIPQELTKEAETMKNNAELDVETDNIQ